MDVANALRKLETAGWLRSQPPEIRRRLVACGRVTSFGRGAWIYAAEDRVGALFAIVEGAARIYATPSRRPPVMIELMTPGAWFGQNLHPGARRIVTAIADAAPTRALVIHRGDLLALVANTPSLMDSLIDLSARQIRRSVDHLAEVLSLPPAARVAGRLLALTPRGTDRSRSAPITQNDLAEMTGLRRQAVNRALGDFAAAGLVRRGYGVIEVLDRRGLERQRDSGAG